MRKFLLLWLLLAVLCSAHSQSLTGKVLQISENGDTTVVPNAAVQWLHTDIGAYTDTYGNIAYWRLADNLNDNLAGANTPNWS